MLDAIQQDENFCNVDGGDDPDFDFVFDGTVQDCNNKPPSFVYSVSYAGAEIFPIKYMQRQCTEYGKVCRIPSSITYRCGTDVDVELGLAGMTFLYASGDNGVASNAENLCITLDGEDVAVGEGNFLPNFPATCPYVTAVGSTQVDPGKSVRPPFFIYNIRLLFHRL